MVKKLRTLGPKTELAKTVVVIGLGRFGGSLAKELVTLGREVLGVDTDERRVQAFAPILSHVVKATSTDEEVLRELGVTDFDAAVVAVGSDLEVSILTASILLQMGVKQVWAKATSESHGRILKQLGVHHVVYPEAEMGKRVAHQVGGDQLDYVEIDEGFVMAKTRAAEAFNGMTLDQLGLRREYGIIVVATSAGNSEFKASTPQTVLVSGDFMIVAGPKDRIEAFCKLG
ncbi:MAG: potassium channel family protein [Micrococcales bacterium]